MPDDTTTEPQKSDANEAAQQFIFGVILLLVGGPHIVYARPIARFGEQIDAIGSTTPASEVEPAVWKVWLTKAGGVVVTFVGVVFVLMAVL
jgi:hypothetical protein